MVDSLLSSSFLFLMYDVFAFIDDTQLWMLSKYVKYCGIQDAFKYSRATRRRVRADVSQFSLYAHTPGPVMDVIVTVPRSTRPLS